MKMQYVSHVFFNSLIHNDFYIAHFLSWGVQAPVFQDFLALS